ncbi:MAG: TonB-dependent receptor [Sphingobacteriia bacterium]|jgi:outer membrane receptor for ferrienterochelin and colicins
MRFSFYWILIFVLVLANKICAQQDSIGLLKPMSAVLSEVVVTGTMKEVKRLESPVPVELYNPAFFRKNPTSCIFDGLQLVNGVRPQINCNVCNTGDIRINGLPGPYTMVLIDGMPIVSSLSTVYGLSGIPNSLVERIEIVKGPASSLYGSEAVGGLINIITKKTTNAPTVSVELMTTTWNELNADLGFNLKAGKKATVLTGINYFNYNTPKDVNGDSFTDLTLQKRISLFQKWNFNRANNRLFNIAARYYNENRWGGDMRWNEQFRGGDSIYGESIYTNRWEILGNYELPFKEKLMLSYSLNQHDQDSRYGTTSFIAKQKIAFAQLTWDKAIGMHDWLIGAAFRYTYYNDNTPASGSTDPLKLGISPLQIALPGVFAQDEIKWNDQHKILLGIRYDYHSVHGNIFTPRIAYKYTINEKNFLRINAGTGFRVVNLFTEDHAALTGARSVVIAESLKPEKSLNININYNHKIFGSNGNSMNIDATLFYTYFNNRIVGDFDTNPNQIIYANLNGHAVSKGASINIDWIFKHDLKLLLGATFLDVGLYQSTQKEQQILTEKFSGTWTVSYTIPGTHIDIDYTGNIYGPMRLPVLGPLDPRKEFSPWWSIQNIQFSFHVGKKIELYAGIKNLLNYLPTRNNPFIIARTNDPFDKQVQYNSNGQVLPTPDNPYALTFDPNYVYAPNQGIRGFIGVRMNIQ